MTRLLLQLTLVQNRLNLNCKKIASFLPPALLSKSSMKLLSSTVYKGNGLCKGLIYCLLGYMWYLVTLIYLALAYKQVLLMMQLKFLYLICLHMFYLQ